VNELANKGAGLTFLGKVQQGRLPLASGGESEDLSQGKQKVVFSTLFLTLFLLLVVGGTLTDCLYHIVPYYLK